jgi:WD40 repeat protein
MMLTNTVRFRLASMAAAVALMASLPVQGQTLHGVAGQKSAQQGLAKPVTSVAFSPDGKTLAALVVEQGVTLWDPATGKSVANLKNLNFSAGHVGFTSDGKILQIWGENSPWNRYDLPSGRPRDPGFATYSPDGRIAIMPGGIGRGKSELRVTELTRPFDASSGQNSFTLAGAQSGFNASYGQDGKTLAVRGEDLSIMVWDVASRKNTAKLPQSYGRSWFGLSPDGKILAVQEFKKTTGKMITAPDVSDTVLTLFDAATGKVIGALEPDQNGGSPVQIVFSPDSKTVTAESNVNSPRTKWYFIRVWDATTGKKLAPLQKSPATIRKPVVFSPDCKTLAALCEDHKIRVWDFSSGKITAVLALPVRAEPIPEHGGCVPAFNPDGKSLAAGCWDGTVKLWTLPLGPKTEVAMSFGPAAFPDAAGPPAAFQVVEGLKPIPDGYTVQFVGSHVFLRDARGDRKPMPDGDYRMPNGVIIHVRGGQKTF